MTEEAKQAIEELVIALMNLVSVPTAGVTAMLATGWEDGEESSQKVKDRYHDRVEPVFAAVRKIRALDNP